MIPFALWMAGLACIGFGMLIEWEKDGEPMAIIREMIQIALWKLKR
jgi:hypothetical protein